MENHSYAERKTLKEVTYDYSEVLWQID
jgi:hypothetical protein